MAKLPYMQFYPADYLVDTQPLSAAARGAWMDMLCMMWRSEQRGILEFSPMEWCRVLRVTQKELSGITRELEIYNVCEISTLERNGKDIVRVCSRRMLREEKHRKNNCLYVRKSRSKKSCKVTESECKPENQISDIRYQNQISESEEEKKEENTLSRSSRDDLRDAREVLQFLNAKTGKRFREVDSTLRMIAARLKGDGKSTAVDVQTCKSLIARKAREWMPDEKMQKYLRPETLFNRTKFESYLGELNTCITPNPAQNVSEHSQPVLPAALVAGELLRSLSRPTG